MSETLALFEEHKRNGEWFKKNYQHLVEKYDDMFVAIHKQEIVAFDKDPSKLREKILAKGLVPLEKPLEFIL